MTAPLSGAAFTAAWIVVKSAPVTPTVTVFGPCAHDAVDANSTVPHTQLHQYFRFIVSPVNLEKNIFFPKMVQQRLSSTSTRSKAVLPGVHLLGQNGQTNILAGVSTTMSMQSASLSGSGFTATAPEKPNARWF